MCTFACQPKSLAVQVSPPPRLAAPLRVVRDSGARYLRGSGAPPAPPPAALRPRKPQSPVPPPKSAWTGSSRAGEAEGLQLRNINPPLPFACPSQSPTVPPQPRPEQAARDGASRGGAGGTPSRGEGKGSGLWGRDAKLGRGEPCKWLRAGRGPPGWGGRREAFPCGDSGESGGLRGVGTPPGGREKPRTGGAGGTGSAARAASGGTEPCGRAAVLGSPLAAPRTALSPCPGAAPRAPGKRPRRGAEHRAPPAPRGQDPLLPAGGWRRRAKKPSGYRQAFLPSPHTSSASLRVRAAYFQAMLPRKVAPVGQRPPALPPSVPPQPRTSRPRRAPALRSARVSAKIAFRPGCSRSASTCSTFCFDLWK
ncbi:basic salivary proline-rich protein 1-like [Melospiza melodia melodia]|uniref:basic salivary proline-rich protein 1-like n=1 Tax=Melospiza melodia melodia TaxID=1914991 RepID=UPI002FD2CECE